LGWIQADPSWSYRRTPTPETLFEISHTRIQESENPQIRLPIVKSHEGSYYVSAIVFIFGEINAPSQLTSPRDRHPRPGRTLLFTAHACAKQLHRRHATDGLEQLELLRR
jgi:hypothetical protein